MRAPLVSFPVLWILTLCSAGLAASACGGGSSPPAGPTQRTVNSVTVSGPTTLTVGAAGQQYTATAAFSDGSQENVSGSSTWSSTNGSAASVNNTGQVTALAAGATDIRATHQNVSGSLTVQVNAVNVPPEARFTVSGPGGNNVCRLLGNGVFDCEFDGSASTGGTGGNVARWLWQYDVGKNSDSIDDDDPSHQPDPGCGFFQDKPDDGGSGFVQMIVRLRVRNQAGETSGEERNSNVRLFHQGNCGF